MNRFWIVLLIFALLRLASPVQAEPEVWKSESVLTPTFTGSAAVTEPPHARVLVVVADHLTLSDFRDLGAPHLTLLLQQGQIAMMSPGLARGDDPVSDAYATLGAGDSIRQGDLLQGSLADALRAAHVPTATLGDADGDDTGAYRPLDIFLPGAPHISGGFASDPLAPGGVRCDPIPLAQITNQVLAANDLVIVHDGDFARLERENRAGDLLPAAYAAHRRRALQTLDAYAAQIEAPSPPSDIKQNLTVFLIVPTAPLDSHEQWNRLTPFVRWTSGSLAGTLTSDTTQTLGLIAARDIAPTLLAALNAHAPITMTGALVHPTQVRYTFSNLDRLDRLTYLNQKIQIPFFWGLGFLGGGLVFFAVWFYVATRLAPQPTARRALQFGVRMLAAWPAALLIAPMLPVRTEPEYLAAIVGATAALALLPSPAWIAIVTCVLVITDAMTGTRLISQSALSAYYLSGIRFYGIGNEYMGVLLGASLIAATMLPKPNGKRWPWGLAWFALITFILSFPAFGAKAGGAITAVLTFKVMWQKMRGRPLKAKHMLVGLAIGIGVVLFWGLIGHVLGLRRTHIDTAVGALEGRRFGYIMGVALRKAGLALRVALHPGTLLGLAALGTLGTLGCSLLKRPLLRFYERRPAYRVVLEAGVAGCAACALLNDSGVVAAILLFITIVLPVLHDLLGEERCDWSPSISEK